MFFPYFHLCFYPFVTSAVSCLISFELFSKDGSKKAWRTEPFRHHLSITSPVLFNSRPRIFLIFLLWWSKFAACFLVTLPALMCSLFSLDLPDLGPTLPLSFLSSWSSVIWPRFNFIRTSGVWGQRGVHDLPKVVSYNTSNGFAALG